MEIGTFQEAIEPGRGWPRASSWAENGGSSKAFTDRKQH